MTDLPAELMDKLHAEALAEDAARQPYCTGDRCEATCGCCPRVAAQDWCWLSSEREDGSRSCSQHGEGWLNDRSPEAERRYEILRRA